MADNDQAGKDQPPSPIPSFDDVDRVADSFTPMWAEPAAPVPAPAPQVPAPAPAQVVAAPNALGAPPQAVPAPLPVEPRPAAAVQPAAQTGNAAPQQAPTGGIPKRTMLGMAPPPGLAAAAAAANAAQAPAPVAEPAPVRAKMPSPVPEEAAPDSKSEYAPPRALPAAQRTMLGMSPPVSVDLPPGTVNTAPAAVAEPAYEQPDQETARLDTIPPRRRQAGARRIVFGVMGVAIALVAAVGVRQMIKPSSEAHPPVPARVEIVAAKTAVPAPEPSPAPSPPPAASTTEVAAAEAAPEPPPAETAEPEKPAPETRKHEPVVEVAHAAPARAPRRAAPPPPRTPEKKAATRKESGKSTAAPPPPSPGGGSIVRESPF
jgi:hypothetical protein